MSGPTFDFRGIILPDFNIQAFTTKPAAVKFAKQRRWPLADVRPGFNRFEVFWFVGQYFPNGELLIATKEPGKTVVMFVPTGIPPSRK